MPVQIQINGENADEAVKELSALASHFTGAAPIAASTEKSAPKKEDKPKQEKPKAADKPKPKKEEPETEGAESNDSDQEGNASDSDGEYIPTVVDLRAKAQEKGKTPEDKKKIKALLDEFGSKSISDVPEESRIEFMQRLEDL